MSILSMLNSDNYRTYNLFVAQTLESVNAAIMLSEFVNRYEFHKNHNELIKIRNQEGEWFYFTEEKCRERTALSREEQDRAINILIKKGLVKKVVAGLPAKRHFQIDEMKIFELLANSKNVYSLRETHKLECVKPTNRNVENPQTTKETKEEPLSKKTTTKKRGSSSSSLIDRKLRELDELPLEAEQKSTLYQHFEDDQILNAIAVYKNRKKQPDDLGAFLFSACKKSWKNSKTLEENIESNKKLAKKLLSKYDDNLYHAGYKVCVLTNHIEFECGGQPKFINYDDKDFKMLIEKLENKLKEKE